MTISFFLTVGRAGGEKNIEVTEPNFDCMGTECCFFTKHIILWKYLPNIRLHVFKGLSSVKEYTYLPNNSHSNMEGRKLAFRFRDIN